jgi:hypothetical protein
VPQAGRYRHGVAGADLADLVFDLHAAATFKEVVNLFGSRMEMRRGRFTRRDAGFGEALVPNCGIAVRQQLADLGTIFRGKWPGVGEVDHVHARIVPRPGGGAEGVESFLPLASHSAWKVARGKRLSTSALSFQTSRGQAARKRQ